MNRKLQCSKKRWENVALEEVAAAGLCPKMFMAGCRWRAYVQARWRVWQRLLDAGCSSAQIAWASGYNHTSILHACNPEMRVRRIQRYINSRQVTKPRRLDARAA